MCWRRGREKGKAALVWLGGIRPPFTPNFLASRRKKKTMRKEKKKTLKKLIWARHKRCPILQKTCTHNCTHFGSEFCVL